MNFYSHRTVEEQKNRLPEDFQENYEKTQLDRITIDGEEIVGYFEYSFMEEKTYKTQPVRSDDGSIQDLESYQTFLTPRLIIKYNMMGIEDYRKLMKKLKSKNTFVVTCYDIVEDKRVTHEMYFAPPSMPIIYQRYLMAMGVQDCSIELIGTNYSQYYTVTYDRNSSYYGYGTAEELAETFTDTASSSQAYTVKSESNTMIFLWDDYANRIYGTRLIGWNTDVRGNGWSYSKGQSCFVSGNITLYAQYG